MKKLVLFCALGLFLEACRSLNQASQGVNSTLEFAAKTWEVKAAEYRQGPGGNIFSASKKNVAVDRKGHLHLAIRKEKENWTCAELYSQEPMGYGHYYFVVEKEFSAMDPMAVFAFFTYDKTNFVEQANSEIDIEFSRWCNPLSAEIVHYTVHPSAGARLHLERQHRPSVAAPLWDGITSHHIIWTDSLVEWQSYPRTETHPDSILGYFRFQLPQPERTKYKDGVAIKPIGVPQPGLNTQVHFNLWLFKGSAPYKGKEEEVIIRDFSYTPF
jgi:hypothetical protein